jgi:HEAT repeat protein
MAGNDDSGRSGPEAALATLRAALHDPVVEVRREAALALGQLGDLESAQALTEALASDAEPVKRAAALALGRVSTEDTRQALLASLRGDPSVWRECAAALSRRHDHAILDGLSELLADSEVNEHARRGAALALGALLAGEPLKMETPVFEDEQGKLHVII